MMAPNLDSSNVQLKEDVRRLVGIRTNILITGRPDAVRAVLTECDFRNPVVCVAPGGRLPPTNPRTLVILRVDALDTAEQRDLAAWVDMPQRVTTQVISLAEQPLYQRVKNGLFDEALYYRLNTISLDFDRR